MTDEPQADVDATGVRPGADRPADQPGQSDHRPPRSDACATPASVPRRWRGDCDAADPRAGGRSARPWIPARRPSDSIRARGRAAMRRRRPPRRQHRWPPRRGAHASSMSIGIEAALRRHSRDADRVADHPPGGTTVRDEHGALDAEQGVSHPAARSRNRQRMRRDARAHEESSRAVPTVAVGTPLGGRRR